MATPCYVLHYDVWLKTECANSLSAATAKVCPRHLEQCREQCSAPNAQFRQFQYSSSLPCPFRINLRARE
eukprot:4541950-Amphidinium_carterae.1